MPGEVTNPPGIRSMRLFTRLSVLAVAGGGDVMPAGRRLDVVDLKLACEPFGCMPIIGGRLRSGSAVSGRESCEPFRIRPVPPKPFGGPGLGRGGSSPAGAAPFGRPDIPRPFGARGLLSRLPVSSGARDGERLSGLRPAVGGRLPYESGVLSRGGPRFDIDVEGVVRPTGRIWSRLGLRLGSRMGSIPYGAPGGGVEDCDDGALCEKREPWTEPEVLGRFLGGGSAGNSGEGVGASAADGPRGRPGLNGGICGGGPGEPPDGLLTPAPNI